MQISVSSTLTVFHDGQFWVGIVEHIEDGRLGAARIVFGAEPSDEEVLRFVVEKWHTLAFGGSQVPDDRQLSKSPKRRQREASKALKQPPASTKAQLALAEQREASKRLRSASGGAKRGDEPASSSALKNARRRSADISRSPRAVEEDM